MNLFLKTSHKTIVFILFLTVWTDLILPKEYKNSDLAFGIWIVFLYAWFYFAFRHLSKFSQKAYAMRVYYFIALGALLITAILKWGFGIDTDYFDLMNFGFWKLICYLFLVFTISKTLLELEQTNGVNIHSISTFILVFILPIGAWWIHKRIQKIVLSQI